MPKVITNTISINSRGQLVLPIQIRKEMDIIGGGKMLFSFDPNNKFTTLKPIVSDNFIEKWAGVIDTNPELDTKQYLAKSRKADKNKENQLLKKNF